MNTSKTESVPVQQAESVAINERQISINKQLELQLSRLRESVNKIIGRSPIPPVESGEKLLKDNVADSFTSAMMIQQSTSEGLLGQLRLEIDKLEKFA